jgi:1-aminocyclopropane-1-carboxylate deaminase
LAIKGCEEILNNETISFDYICSPIGTAGTITGLINSKSENQKILGFPAVKNINFEEEICKLTCTKGYEVIYDYHFGGYGKVKDELIQWINWFKDQTTIPLDPIYTGKMMYGIFDLIQNNYFFPNSSILAIHTGGLQGIEGINKILTKNTKRL